ncbi:MAG: ATP synthase F1 subunit delta [Bacillota bacterium]|nr:ATP synthase F1 subunit delta [Bacillota bacterium]
MQNRVVAGRYAAALLRTAVAYGELDRVEQDLDLLTRSLAAEETLGRFLDSPRERPAAKKQLVEKVFGERLSPTTRRFFYLLIDKKRHSLLPLIAQRYREHADEVRGVTVAKVRVSRPLTPEGEAAVQAKVKALTGRAVRLEVKVDPAVVGGICLRVGNRIIDYTLQRQLSELREDIIAGTVPRGRRRPGWQAGVRATSTAGVRKGNEHQA